MPQGPAPPPPRTPRVSRRARARVESLRAPVASGDEANRTLIAEIRPRPLDQHHDPVAEPNQLDQVDEQPREPSGEPLQLRPVQIRDRRCPADRGHVAVIAITEWTQRLSLDGALDVAGG